MHESAASPAPSSSSLIKIEDTVPRPESTARDLEETPNLQQTSSLEAPVSSSTDSLSLATIPVPECLEGSPYFNAPLSMPQPSHQTHVPMRQRKSLLHMNPVCNFEAFSLHFHLPLKVAAEKFGVRATAFKKRCRAIGIRHWPYRKVRSLKRSLHELNRCKEQGALNDKQQYQYTTFKKQLDKLMSPETYGIDPSGRINAHAFDDDDDSTDECSPTGRFGASFGDCSISPDSDRSFGDFQVPPHMRMRRPMYQKPMYGGEVPTVTLRYQPNRMVNGSFDPYFMDSMMMDSSKPMAIYPHDAPEESMGDHPSSGCALDNMNLQHDFMPTEMKYEDVRPVHDGEDHFAETGTLFDDIFCHISPDYGCLV